MNEIEAMSDKKTDTIEQLKILQDPDRCDGITEGDHGFILQRAIDELEQFRQAAVTVRKCQRWLRQVQCEEEPDEATTEDAHYSLDEALHLIVKMADPKWTIGYLDRLAKSSRERIATEVELGQLRKERDQLVDGIKYAGDKLLVMEELRDEHPQLTDLLHHLWGTITDDEGKPMMTTKNRSNDE